MEPRDRLARQAAEKGQAVIGASLRLEIGDGDLSETAREHLQARLETRLDELDTDTLARLYGGTISPSDAAIEALFWVRHGRAGGSWPTQAWRGENLYDVVKVCPHARSAHDVKHQVKRYIERRAIPGLTLPVFECGCGWRGQERMASTDGRPMRLCRWGVSQMAWPTFVHEDGNLVARVCNRVAVVDDPMHGQWMSPLGQECLCGHWFGGAEPPSYDPLFERQDRLLVLQ
jgi:hypothetical protein